MIDTGFAGYIIGIVGGLVGIYALLKNDLREDHKKAVERGDDWQKKFLSSEQARETLQKEVVDLIRDSLQTDQIMRELRRDLAQALSRGNYNG